MLSTNRGTKPMMSAEDRRRREAQRRIDEGLPAKRKYNKLTEQLQEEVDVYRDSNPGVSNRDVGLFFNVAHSTINRYLEKKRLGKEHGKPGRLPGLMPRQERRLYDICLLCSDMGMPLNVEQVRHLVKDYFDANSWQSPTFKDNFPGPTWAFNFIKRFPALTLRLAENKRRIEGTLTAEDLDRYFDRLKPNLEGVPRCRILNMDETRCTMDVGKEKVISRRGASHNHKYTNSNRASATLVMTVASSGAILLPMIVHCGKKVQPEWLPAKEVLNDEFPDVIVAAQPSGWMNKDLMCKWLELCVLRYKNSLGKDDGPLYILLDNVSFHFSYDFLVMCEENDVHPIPLPRNTTFCTQPLDVGTFKSLKHHLKDVIKTYLVNYPDCSTLPKNYFCEIVLTALRSMRNRRSLVRKSFKAAGIYPLNKARVISSWQNWGSKKPHQQPDLDDSEDEHVAQDVSAASTSTGNRSANSSAALQNPNSSAAEDENDSLADALMLANDFDGDEGDEVLEASRRLVASKRLVASRRLVKGEDLPMDLSPTKGAFNPRRVPMGALLVKTMEDQINPGLRDNTVVFGNGRDLTVAVPRRATRAKKIPACEPGDVFTVVKYNKAKADAEQAAIDKKKRDDDAKLAKKILAAATRRKKLEEKQKVTRQAAATKKKPGRPAKRKRPFPAAKGVPKLTAGKKKIVGKPAVPKAESDSSDEDDVEDEDPDWLAPNVEFDSDSDSEKVDVVDLEEKEEEEEEEFDVHKIVERTLHHSDPYGDDDREPLLPSENEDEEETAKILAERAKRAAAPKKPQKGPSPVVINLGARADLACFDVLPDLDALPDVPEDFQSPVTPASIGLGSDLDLSSEPLAHSSFVSGGSQGSQPKEQVLEGSLTKVPAGNSGTETCEATPTLPQKTGDAQTKALSNLFMAVRIVRTPEVEELMEMRRELARKEAAKTGNAYVSPSPIPSNSVLLQPCGETPEVPDDGKKQEKLAPKDKDKDACFWVGGSVDDDYYGDLQIDEGNTSLNNSRKNLMDHYRSPGKEGKSSEVTGTPPTAAAQKKSPTQAPATQTPSNQTPATQTPATQTPSNQTIKIMDLRSLKASLVKSGNSSSQKKLSLMQKRELSLRKRVGVETDEERDNRKRSEKQADRYYNRSPSTPDTPEDERQSLRREIQESFTLKKRSLFPKPTDVPENKRPKLIDMRKRDREDIIAHNSSFKKPAPRPAAPSTPIVQSQPPLTPIHGQKLLPPLKRSYDHYSIDSLIIEDDIPKGMTKHRVFQHLPYSRIKPTQYIAYEHPQIPRILRIGVVGEVPRTYSGSFKVCHLQKATPKTGTPIKDGGQFKETTIAMEVPVKDYVGLLAVPRYKEDGVVMFPGFNWEVVETDHGWRNLRKET